MPFTFNDLASTKDGSTRARFVKLFSKTKPRGLVEADETPSPEDQARKAFEDAYVQGEKAGFEMGMRRVESITKRLEKQIAELISFKAVLNKRYEALSIELALIFSEAIILRECNQNKEILEAMIRKALEACVERGGIVIKVRPEDAKYVEGLASGRFQIIKDESLKEPGFVIETNLGDIDGRLSTQIEELRASLTAYHGE
jgi:flagellar assembly protein FliH